MKDTDFNEVLAKYKKATSKLILLDYDGTLVDFAPFPHWARPSRQVGSILSKLGSTPHARVVIISGRSTYLLDEFLESFPVELVAEHGAMEKINGSWKAGIEGEADWKKPILSLYNRATLSCPNSFIEEKNYSVAWHYRNADAEMAQLNRQNLIKALEDIIPDYNLKIIDGNKVLEIVSTATSKGTAAKKLVGFSTYDFVLAIGDDKTDEEMFTALADNENAITIKVGQGTTGAKYSLKQTSDVLLLLNQLCECG